LVTRSTNNKAVILRGGVGLNGATGIKKPRPVWLAVMGRPGKTLEG